MKTSFIISDLSTYSKAHSLLIPRHQSITHHSGMTICSKYDAAQDFALARNHSKRSTSKLRLPKFCLRYRAHVSCLSQGCWLCQIEGPRSCSPCAAPVHSAVCGTMTHYEGHLIASLLVIRGSQTIFVRAPR